MPTTVKLIRRHSGFANVPDAFAIVAPWQDAPVVDEINTEIAEYMLPDGYTIAKDGYGDVAIFGPGGTYCEIVMHGPTGRPQLVCSDPGCAPVLKRAPRV